MQSQDLLTGVRPVGLYQVPACRRVRQDKREDFKRGTPRCISISANAFPTPAPVTSNSICKHGREGRGIASKPRRVPASSRAPVSNAAAPGVHERIVIPNTPAGSGFLGSALGTALEAGYFFFHLIDG